MGDEGPLFSLTFACALSLINVMSQKVISKQVSYSAQGRQTVSSRLLTNATSVDVWDKMASLQ